MSIGYNKDMESFSQQAATVQTEIYRALGRLHFEELAEKEQELAKKMASPHFWSNPHKAQEIAKQHAKLTSRLEPWRKIKSDIDTIKEIADMDDPDMLADLETQLDGVNNAFIALKDELRFSGPHDDSAAIVSIYAGAGGTDAQDWAQMLLRMYVRWAESHHMQVVTIDESAGDEAGIKSVTLEIDGPFAYGRLKGEHGVHRLVRLSPFNADNLRQTSFAKVDVLPRLDDPAELVTDEKDLRIDVYRSGGHGGQSVNTTDSAVRITHLPTGISVAIQNERSQLQNKEMAMTILRSRLAQMQMEQHQENIQKLKGPNQSAEWGNQIRSYVLHPYKQVKDLRTRYETTDVQAVLDGGIDPLINAYLEHTLGQH